jgi:hypothetical protein
VMITSPKVTEGVFAFSESHLCGRWQSALKSL